MQTTEFGNTLAKFYIGTTAGHIGGDGNLATLPGLGDDLGLFFMMLGIEDIKPGYTLGSLGYEINKYVKKHTYSTVREYCGHGIGKVFHEDPKVLHYGRPGVGELLVPGMVFTIEPMINLGKKDTRLLADGWTVHTKDRSLSAQYEHTLAVTEDGFDALTHLPGDEL